MEKNSILSYLLMVGTLFICFWCLCSWFLYRVALMNNFIELTLIFNHSYVCHDMNLFWPTSFVKFPRRSWTEFSRCWKDSLRSQENFWSLRLITSGANIIGFYWNSRYWLFWVFTMSKINSLMNKSVLFWQDV